MFVEIVAGQGTQRLLPCAGDLSLRKVLALYVSCDPSQTRHHHKQIKIQCRERRATKPATPTGFFSSTILRSADSATVFAG